MWIPNDYLSQVYNVVTFMLSRDNPQTHKNVIFVDSVKFMVIGAAIGCLFKFFRREANFKKYINSMILGSMGGTFYSFNFTNKKVEYLQAKKKLRFDKKSKHLV